MPRNYTSKWRPQAVHGMDVFIAFILHSAGGV